MKIISLVPALAFLTGVFAFTGCQTAAPSYEQSALVEAGFQPVLPETVSERKAYEALPANKVERTDAPGRSVYAYRTKEATYIGGDPEYKRYQALVQKKGREQADNLAMQTNPDAVHGLH